MSIISSINQVQQLQGMQKDNAMLKHLLWVLLLRTILYTLLLVLSYFFKDNGTVTVIPQGLLIVLVIAVYTISFFSALYLLVFPNNIQKFVLTQVFFDSSITSVLVFFTGTSYSNFTIVYFFPIITAGLLLPMRKALVAAAVTTIQIGGLFFLEIKGIFPLYLKEYMLARPINLHQELDLFAVHGVLFFLTALLSILFGQRLRRTETALSHSLQQLDAISLLYKKIFDNISTGILTVDGEQRISSANTALANILGIDNRSLMGMALQEIFPHIQLFIENKRQTLNFRKKNGKIVRIGYSCMRIEQEQYAQQENNAEMIITMRDITELENLEQQVRQAEKLAAIGTMSASIAHDFRNPLTAISGSAQILAADFAQNQEQNSTNIELTAIILRESARLITSIGDFLKFARPEHLQLDWVPLAKCLEEGIHMLAAGESLPVTAEITTDFPQDIALWADEKQLFTLLTHLVQNALPFCPPEEERIMLEAKEEVIRYQKGQEKLSITVTISDNGRGIMENPPETIFEPFHTTRTDGTGLGLAIVQQIVRDHHGSIGVDNNGLVNNDGGRGARFIIHFPLPESENIVDITG